MSINYVLCLVGILLHLLNVSAFKVNIRNSAWNAAARLFSSESDVTDWLNFENCEVLLPVNQRFPSSIIHFTGGFIAGSAVSLGYSPLLRKLALDGHLIIATPIPPLEMNHDKVSRETYNNFISCYEKFIMPSLGEMGLEIPVIGLSHSLGGKLMVITQSQDASTKHCANIFLAFNNYGAKDSFDVSTKQASKLSPELQKVFNGISFSQVQNIINKAKTTDFKSIITSAFGDANNLSDEPRIGDVIGQAFGKQFDAISDVISQVDRFTKEFEFNPTPKELWDLIENKYSSEENIIFKFIDDDIDQSLELAKAIRRGGGDVEVITLPGSHITPNVIDISDSNANILFKELSTQINKLILQFESTDKKGGKRVGGKRDRYLLPGPVGGVYLPGLGGSGGHWDSDNC